MTRIAINAIANPSNLIIPAYCYAEYPGQFPQEAIGRSLARANRAVCISVSSEGMAADRSYRDYKAVMTRNDGRVVGAVTVRVQA